MAKIITLRSTIARPADNTAYTGGDEISNSATAGSVVRATYDLSGFTRGRLLAATMDLTTGDASSVVTTASDFEITLFKTPDTPAAVGDNVTNPFAAAVRALAVGSFRFDDTGWTGPLGTVAAGSSQYQPVGAHLVQPLAANVPQVFWYPGYEFAFDGSLASSRTLTMVLRALAAWTPTGIINTFGVTLVFEMD